MSIIDGLPINFTLSPAARAEIEAIRQVYLTQTDIVPRVCSIAWALYRLDSGERFERPIVGFYGEEQYEEIKKGVERIGDLEVVFFITREHYGYFEGKVLDHDPERSFFLR